MSAPRVAAAASSTAPARRADGHHPLVPPRASVVAVLLGPLMWSLHEVTVYIVTSNLCRVGRGHELVLGMSAARFAILVATVIALGVTLALLALLLTRWRAAVRPDDGAGRLPADRVSFAIRLGVTTAVISAIGISLTALPALVTVCG